MFLNELSHEMLLHNPIISRGGRYVHTFDILPIKQYLMSHHRLPEEEMNGIILLTYLDLLREVPEGREIIYGEYSITALYNTLQESQQFYWMCEISEEIIREMYSFMSYQLDVICQLLFTLYPRDRHDPHGFIRLLDIAVEGNHLYLVSP